MRFAKSLDIGIDLGNSKFSLCVRGEGIVASEASYLAFKGRSLDASNVIAIGDAAKAMYGRVSEGINVISPMRDGIVVDCKAAGLILSRMAKQAGVRWRFGKPRVIVGALYGASSVERKSFVDVASSLGSMRVSAVHEPLAAANGMGMNVHEPYANMVVDVGDGVTEALIVSIGQTVFGNSLRLGGGHIDLAICDYIRKRYDILVSQQQARHLKESLSDVSCLPALEDHPLTLRGLRLDTGLPIAQIINKSELLPIIDKLTDQIVAFVMNTIEHIAPEMAVDLIENGIHLCGGGSQTVGLCEKISHATKLTVRTPPRPDQAVIMGCERMLGFSQFAS